MEPQQDERIEEVSEAYFNLSTAVRFCRPRFYTKKGHFVSSQRIQVVKESDSLFVNIVTEETKSCMGNARTRPQ